MNTIKHTTDNGYLFILGNTTIEVYVEINQTWYLMINGFAFKFESTKQAMNFIHSIK